MSAGQFGCVHNTFGAWGRFPGRLFATSGIAGKVWGNKVSKDVRGTVYEESLLITWIQSCGLIAPLAPEYDAYAVPIVKALADGGVPVIHIPWRGGEGRKIIETCANRCSDVLIITSDVNNPEDHIVAQSAGAKVLVNAQRGEAFRHSVTKAGLVLLPNVETAKQANDALCSSSWLSIDLKKGVDVEAMARSVPNASIVVMGGIDASYAGDYFKLDNILAVELFSLIAPIVIVEKNWREIRIAAERTRLKVEQFRLKEIA